MSDFLQIPFGLAGVASTGYDILSNKGWIQTSIIKDDFHIQLFILHTQADEGEANASIRSQQISFLKDVISLYRFTHRSAVVFAMGDFNVMGATTEYNTSLIPILGNSGARDADRNSPGFIIDCDCSSVYYNPSSVCLEQWTTGRCNKLAIYFDHDTKNGRLDYIFYFPTSWDGSIEVMPQSVEVLKFRGRYLTDEGLRTNESSDHWAVHGKFKLIRK